VADIVDKAVRSRMMAGIKGKNTRPELVLRRSLFRAGYRYRVHVRHLPGKPDIVLGKYKTAIFVHGCFWHGHMCEEFKWPSTRPQFWREKIMANIARDKKATDALVAQGWNVIVVWECEIKKSAEQATLSVVQSFPRPAPSR